MPGHASITSTSSMTGKVSHTFPFRKYPPTDHPAARNGIVSFSMRRTWTDSLRHLPRLQTILRMTLKDDPIVLRGWSCPYCGSPTKLVDDTEIYGRSYGTKCYVCKPCGAWVGCHKNSDKALGRVANKELRQLKHQAHEAFDPLWKDGYLPRTAAYEVLSVAFGLPIEQTHIGMFDEDLCRKVISLSNIILKYIRQDG